MEKDIRFYTNDGLIARVGETKGEKGVPMHAVFVGTEEMEGVDQELTRIRAETSLFEQAKLNKWIPCPIKDALDDPKKVGLQGEAFDITAFVKLPSAEVVQMKTQYCVADVEIDRLEIEFEASQKQAKADHKKEIADLEAVKMRLRRGAIEGEESVEMSVSWERDIENEMMFQVERETGAFRAIREMTAAEKNPDLFDGPKDEDLDPIVEEDNKDFETLHDQDAVQEIDPDTE